MSHANANVVVEEFWKPDAIDTFLFSAALWLPHRIHYDLEFAISQGHRGLVVHGPLQTARLLEAVTKHVRPLGGRIAKCRFRHVTSVFVGDHIRIAVEETAPVELPDGGTQVEYAVQTAVIDSHGSRTVATSGEVLVAFRHATLAEPNCADDALLEVPATDLDTVQ